MSSSYTTSDEIVGMDDQNQMLLFSQQFYPDSYNQLTPQEIKLESSETKPKRRRRKNKGGDVLSSEDIKVGNSLMKKRKLTDLQVTLLEQNFGDEHKLESERKDKLAAELGLDPRQVAVWFQNRRARWKNKKLEEEYSKLKSSHDNVILQKCHLEAEVLQLKERLSETEKELGRVTEQFDGVSIYSPNSSFSVDVEQHYLGGEFNMVEAGYDNLLYIPENNWVNLYGF
ncbi:hypothetical protein MKX03_028513 [Papaver bracteatum]|nr:hypothetical protein MKX03_028513 [Papaver bracteatum]